MWLQDLVLVCLVFAGIFPVTSELQALPFVGFVFPGYTGNFLITSRLKALVLFALVAGGSAGIPL